MKITRREKVILVLNKPLNKYYFSENNFQKYILQKKSIKMMKICIFLFRDQII